MKLIKFKDVQNVYYQLIFLFLELDKNGVCNFCNNYQKKYQKFDDSYKENFSKNFG